MVSEISKKSTYIYNDDDNFFKINIDPSVGVTSCGGSFTAQDSIVALVKDTYIYICI